MNLKDEKRAVLTNVASCRCSIEEGLVAIEYLEDCRIQPLIITSRAILCRLDMEAKRLGEDAIFCGNAWREDIRNALKIASNLSPANQPDTNADSIVP